MEQTNQYVKQFPDLMKGKTVMYVHGFASSAQSGTVARLRKVLPSARVVAHDLPLHPQEALDLLHATCEKEHPDLIIGTSMGGMYTEQLYGYDRILINPAFEMADTMKAHGMTGNQQFQNPRQDGVQEFIVTKSLVKEYKEATEQCFQGLQPLTDDDGTTLTAGHYDAERQRVWGLFGDADTTVDTFALFSRHYSKALRFHGEHRMNDHSFMHSVLPVIRWIDDRQEQRQRPIIFIDLNALKDKWNKPQSSCQKTVRWLLERYQLFFVAPAAADATPYSDTLAWLYEYINVPAYAHTIFTNQMQLLYGDYLISSRGAADNGSDADNKAQESLATLIDFGSDTFKTWDDIMDYFSRLGGQ